MPCAEDSRPAVGAALAVAACLLAAACSSSGPATSPSERHDEAAANRDIAAAAKAIHRCWVDADHEYPASFANQTGAITLLCGSVSESLTVAHGGRLTYRTGHGGYLLTLRSAGGSTYAYDSKSGKTTKS